MINIYKSLTLLVISFCEPFAQSEMSNSVEWRNQFFAGRDAKGLGCLRGKNVPRHAQINLRFANKQGAGFNYLPTD